MTHLAGTKLRVGLGYSTVRPSFDLETYSEAGFEWSEADGKWLKTSTDAKGRGGLPAVGAAAYAQHPTTEILSMVYDLKDGVGPRLWLPGQPLPADFCAHIAAGGEIEAHGAKFELWIWQHVAVPRYGFPPIDPAQLYCSMGKARAWSLPPALADVGDVLGIEHQKDAEGKRLLDRFSVPRKPTKKDPRKRIRPEEDPVDGPRLYSYNARDVLAEDEVSAATPDMPADRRAYWLLDLAINRRGIPVDRAGVDNCIVVLEQALERYNAELATLTGGAVKKASEVQRLVGWLAGKGCYVDSLDQEAVEGKLKELRANRSLVPFANEEACIRALEIRQAIGSAAVKKVYALRGQMTAANRVHDLFTVDGARTGRPTGSGPQPTNFPNSGPEVRKCVQCGRWHPAERVACPWCFAVRGPDSKAEEWNADAAEDGLLAIATRDLDFVEAIWTDALAVMGGCLRSLLCTDEEHEFICSDYSAIEAVVNAMLAGEQWRIDVFRTHGKIYEASAAETFKVPLEEIMAHKTETGHHHPLRKKGKVTELACFTAETQVLTNRGYLAIVDVLKSDKLWDGVEWVSHAGVVAKGKQGVLRVDGAEMTPQHKTLCGTSWLEASRLASNESILALSLATGSANLPSSAFSASPVEPNIASAYAPAGEARPRTPVACESARQRGAIAARNSRRTRPAAVDSDLSYRNPPSDESTAGFTQRLTAATTPSAPGTKITAREESRCIPSGEPIAEPSSRTSLPSTAGTPPASTWTGSTTIEATSRVIYDSSRASKTQRTAERFQNSKPESLTSKPVYDIAFAGPRSRFTIKTASGHLIVHNCGFLGWVGAIRQMGGYDGTDDEARELILKWRAASPNIVFLGGGQSCPQSTQQWHLQALAAGGATNAGPEWEVSRARADNVPPWKGVPYMHGLEGMAVLAIQNPETQYPVMRLDGTFSGLTMYVHADVLYMFLPDGSYIPYHRPRLAPGKDDWRGLRISYEGYNTNPKMGAYGWCVMTTYSGKLLENACQATANRILRHGQHRLEAAGYPVVLHVYDENAAEVPKGFGSIEQFEAEMNVMPPWAAGWPIKAKGGWRGRRYRK